VHLIGRVAAEQPALYSCGGASYLPRMSSDGPPAASPPSLPPSLLGLRHLALKVRNLSAVERFYVEGLGMQVEWRPDPDNVYLTTGGQDNLALHRVDEPLAASSSLDHLGIVVARPEHVDQVAARLQALGYPADTPLRDHRDGARSFYLRDPEGNRVQIIYHPPISGPR
jgi:catechol 2,3-dioxygenase-like lactoylglutathione lyase family enzyme